MLSVKKIYGDWIKERIFPILFLLLVILHILAKNYLAVILPNMGIEIIDQDLIAGLIFLSIIYFLGEIFKVGFKPRHYVIAFILAILSFILNPLYSAFFYYDKLLHFTQSMLLSSLIFYMVGRNNIKLKWALIITIFIMVGVGSVFELSEFGADTFLNWETQGVLSKTIQGKIGQLSLALDPLTDTNLDMLFNLLGSISYSILFVYEEYVHNKRRGSLRAVLNARSSV